MNRLNAKGAPKPMGFYIKLVDRTGKKDVRIQVLDSLSHNKFSECEMIHDSYMDGPSEKPAIYAENLTIGNVEYALRMSHQDSAIMVDTWGRYWRIRPGEPKIELGTGFFTTEPKMNSKVKTGAGYLTLRHA